MVWASAQGASGTGLLCEFYREEDVAHYLVHGGRVDCSKPFSSVCSWADEQSQSWAPNLSQCKNPPLPVQHIRRVVLGKRSATFSSWLCYLCMFPAPSSVWDQPVPVGWCQLVLCTLSRGNGISCVCPAHRLPAAAVTHAAGFPLHLPASPVHSHPSLAGKGVKYPAYRGPTPQRLLLLLVCRHLPAPHHADHRAGGTRWVSNPTTALLNTLSTGTCLLGNPQT